MPFTLASDGSPPSAGELRWILMLIQSDRAVKSFSLACAFIVLWDIAITMDQEVKYIWKRKPFFTFVNALYFWNRYYAPLSIVITVVFSFILFPEPSFCDAAARWSLYSAIVNAHVGQALLMIRLWALYSKTRKTYVFLFIVFCTSVAVSFIAGSIGLTRLTLDDCMVPEIIRGCFFSTPTTWVIYVNNLVVETLMFVMTILRVSRAVRTVSSRRSAPLLSHILQSGTLYFFAVMIALIFSIAGYFIIQLLALSLTSLICATVMTIACSRSLLSMRALVQAEIDISIPSSGPINTAPTSSGIHSPWLASPRKIPSHWPHEPWSIPDVEMEVQSPREVVLGKGLRLNLASEPYRNPDW